MARNRNIVFDITKYILSLMIVIIHVGPFTAHLYPLLTIAVPLFFIISSYLLFLKITEHPDCKDKILILYKKKSKIILILVCCNAAVNNLL